MVSNIIEQCDASTSHLPSKSVASRRLGASPDACLPAWWWWIWWWEILEGAGARIEAPRIDNPLSAGRAR